MTLMKHHLIYKDSKSDKFWQIEVTGKSFTVTYGKTGTDGTSQTKAFDSEEKCLKVVEKLLKEKLKRRYKLIPTASDSRLKESDKLKSSSGNYLVKREQKKIHFVCCLIYGDKTVFESYGLLGKQKRIKRHSAKSKVEAQNLCENLIGKYKKEGYTIVGNLPESDIAKLEELRSNAMSDKAVDVIDFILHSDSKNDRIIKYLEDAKSDYKNLLLRVSYDPKKDEVDSEDSEAEFIGYIIKETGLDKISLKEYYKGKLKVIQKLIRYYEAEFKKSSVKIKEALIRIKKNDFEGFKDILSSIENVNSSFGGKLLLNEAVKANSEKFARILLKRGATPNLIDYDGGSPILDAIRHNNLVMVKLLISNGCDINGEFEALKEPFKENESYINTTPFRVAIQYTRTKIIKFLLECNVEYGIYALMDAILVDNKNCFDLIINGIEEDVNELVNSTESDFYETTLLHIASSSKSKNSIHYIKSLLRKGADVNARNFYEQTPIYEAIKNINIETVKLLIKSGAEVNAYDENGETPLFKAVSKKNSEIMKLLIKNGADLTVESLDGLKLLPEIKFKVKDKSVLALVNKILKN